jgi:hypothetical protein
VQIKGGEGGAAAVSRMVVPNAVTGRTSVRRLGGTVVPAGHVGI